MVQVNQDGQQLSGTQQLLVYADVNILGRSIHTIKKNMEALVCARKETGLDTRNMVMSRDQNAGQSFNIKSDNNSFERVEQFMYSAVLFYDGVTFLNIRS
jgi:hypothetical protein